MLYYTEPARAAWQLSTLPLAMPWLRRAPRAAGHGVLVLPGLLASDASTAPMRRYLGYLGHHVRGWRLGRNIGPTNEALDGLRRALLELADATGASVSVIGWSLGGIFAREIAREDPHAVRQVITMGSPFTTSDAQRSRADRAYQRFTHRHDAERVPTREQIGVPISVPSTAVYSRRDGIVAWQTCIAAPSVLHENVEVRSAHLGFGVDPATLWLVADRLAQPQHSWQPFTAPATLCPMYPRTE
jgi:pimeloyl-ACP methyl ester carboxylesterase